MTLNQHTSMPVDIPKKRKHRHQDNLDEKPCAYSLRISTQDNRNDPRGFPNDNTRSTIYQDAASAWRPTKTVWEIRSRGTIGEKLDHAEPVSGGGQVAEAILFRMIDEELDEGELADTEDAHGGMGRRPRFAWRKRKYGRQPTAMAQATPEVVTDIEDWD